VHNDCRFFFFDADSDTDNTADDIANSDVDCDHVADADPDADNNADCDPAVSVTIADGVIVDVFAEVNNVVILLLVVLFLLLLTLL